MLNMAKHGTEVPSKGRLNQIGANNNDLISYLVELFM